MPVTTQIDIGLSPEAEAVIGELSEKIDQLIAALANHTPQISWTFGGPANQGAEVDITKSQDPFAPDVPATHMLAGAPRDPKPSAEPPAEPEAADAAVDAPVDAPEPEDAFAFTSGGTPLDPTPLAASAGPTDTTTEEDADELPAA